MTTFKRVSSLIFSMALLLAVRQHLAAEPPLAEKKTKEEKLAEKEKKSEEKNAANYEKVKEFSLNKYKTDPEFRDSVDAHFDEVMREHSAEAFHTNVNRNSHLVAVSE